LKRGFRALLAPSERNPFSGKVDFGGVAVRAVRIVRCISVLAGGLGLLLMNAVAPVAALAQRSAGPSPARAGLVASAGNMHGFGLAYEAQNADGSVTAAWRDKKVTVVYLGGAGAKVSISTARGTRHRERLLVGASNPHAVSAGVFQRFGASRLSVERSMTADVLNAGLPPAAARLMARADSKAVLTAANSPDEMTSWCVATVYGDARDVIGTGCDVRTVLQAAPQNNVIEDEMQGMDVCDHAGCLTQPGQGQGGLLTFNVHMDYYAGNQVVALDPLGSANTNCSNGVTFTAGPWVGVMVSATEITCGGTMTPRGLSATINAGGYWTANSNGVSITDGPLTIQQAMEIKAPVHTNPDSTLYLFQSWNNHGDKSGDGGSCPNTEKC
jgi:hypothetical protein